MTEKRFHKGYVLGDTGLIDEQKGEWFIENINSISNLRKNWDKVIDKLNEVNDEKEKLKQISDNKQKHIVHLENKIHRMRKNIKKLEGLYHYAGWEGTGEMK